MDVVLSLPTWKRHRLTRAFDLADPPVQSHRPLLPISHPIFCTPSALYSLHAVTHQTTVDLSITTLLCSVNLYTQYTNMRPGMQFMHFSPKASTQNKLAETRHAILVAHA
jgi:hypothetical protein